MNLRTLLILGRASNLPTVWSNLLAGIVFAEAIENVPVVAATLAGGSFIYIGGMYLNDYCDAAFDAQYCRERPIPAGQISRRTVGGLAFLWFFLGFAFLTPLGWAVTGLSLALIAAVVAYDFRHKGVAWAPLLMGFCRFLLYFLAPAALPGRVGWTVIISDAAALALYVAGITYLARGESRPGKPARWALLLLLAPVVLPVFVGLPNFLFLHWLGAVALLLAWMVWLLVPFWRKTKPSIGRVVSGLLAGIVLVDIVAVTPVVGFEAALFLPLFLLALLLQRFVPAT
ncbi:MAG TPA: UbiA family prenyltransferase [Candidatus Methylacidiphilales bacterium]|jgi:4-hydroxybenzoate polyprenyltransferase|nr:UbiA family prenyltransferase [Candidatus Methylacidiphilales bacterium]